MEFSEIYRGVTISVRYDPVTLTFIGGLTGLGHPVSIQAATYEDLQDACTKAVDDARHGLRGRAAPRGGDDGAEA